VLEKDALLKEQAGQLRRLKFVSNAAPENQMLAAGHCGSRIELEKTEPGDRLDHITRTLDIQHLRHHSDLSCPLPAESNHEVKP